MKGQRKSVLAIITLLVIALAGAACGKKSTPTEAFKAFYNAAKNKDAAAMKKTMSKRLLAELEEMAKRRNKPFDELLVSVNLPDTMPEVTKETIEGDTATLEIKGSPKPSTFVKEDGEWKLDSK